MKTDIKLVPLNCDFKSAVEVEKAFNANKDFTVMDITSLWDGKPANKSNLIQGGVKNVFIRYNNLRRVHLINLN